MNLNKVILIGRLTADPQLRTTTSGQPVTSFSVATNRFWTDKGGQKQESTEFHNIVVWGRQAEVVNQFLKKGSLAMIEGRLQTRTWQGNDGQNRKTTEIIAERVQFGPRSSGDSGSAPAPRPPASKEKGEDKDKENKDKKEEKIPEINVDDEGEEIKGENIPF